MLRLLFEQFRNRYRGLRRASEIKKYKGDQVECPICNSTFRIFASFGMPRRSNARCLSCGSLERHRLLWMYFNQRTDIFGKEKVKLIHFAPEETFFNLFANHPAIEYFPCDLFPELYNYKGPVKVEKADITAIPHKDNTFDVILCNHVLEHIADDRKAMRELLRVLKPGGWGILQVPIDYKRDTTYEDFSITTPAGRKKAFGQDDHVRWYGRDYKDRLSEIGFTVLEDDFIGTFSKEDAYRYGFMPGEFVYYCSKPS